MRPTGPTGPSMWATSTPSLGVDQTPIADGDSFSLVYTVG